MSHAAPPHMPPAPGREPDRLLGLAMRHLEGSLMPAPVHADLPLRSAIQPDRLPAVLQAAGAPLPSLDAARALGDAAAHAIAARLAGVDAASVGHAGDARHAVHAVHGGQGGLDPSVLAAARQAASGPGMRMAMQLAGLPRTAYPPDQVREALAHELARIAQDAAQVARERRHDLDRACVEAAADNLLGASPPAPWDRR